MDDETKSGRLTHQLGRSHAWKGGIAGQPYRETVSLTSANMCQGDSGEVSAFARERIVVEHGIRRARRYACLTQTDRHHRAKHTERTRAVVGLVNRRLDRQQRCRAA